MQVKELTIEEYTYRQSEAFALREEQEEMQWHMQFDAQRMELLQIADQYLLAQTPEAYQILSETLLDPVLQERYAKDEMVVHLLILLDIYEQERSYQMEHTILEQGTSVQELVSFFQSLKFLLWRVEFFDTEHSTEYSYGDVRREEEALFQFIQKRDISMIALRVLVDRICVDPPKMLFFLANRYLDQGCFMNTYLLLEYYNAKYPGNADVEETLKLMMETTL